MMMKYKIALASILTLILALTVIGVSAGANADISTGVSTGASADLWKPVTITDDYGFTVEITNPPEKIISLAPTNTEILFALGLGDKVVGVTNYCTYPQEALSKNKVSDYSIINVEKIVVLNPDLIIAAHGNPKDIINHLRELGFKVVMTSPDTINETISGIELIGKATGKVAESKSLTSSITSSLKEIAEKTAGLKKPSVLHCLGADPLYVSGTDTLQDELIAIAGGINAAASETGWVVLSMEKLLTMNPDIIVVDSGMGMGVGDADTLKRIFTDDPRMSKLSAVQNDRVFVVDADIIDRGGPRITEGATAFAKVIHPEVFGEYEESKKAASSPGFMWALVLLGLAMVFVVRRR